MFFKLFCTDVCIFIILSGKIRSHSSPARTGCLSQPAHVARDGVGCTQDRSAQGAANVEARLGRQRPPSLYGRLFASLASLADAAARPWIETNSQMVEVDRRYVLLTPPVRPRRRDLAPRTDAVQLGRQTVGSGLESLWTGSDTAAYMRTRRRVLRWLYIYEFSGARLDRARSKTPTFTLRCSQRAASLHN